jgi:hypothetical protein
MILLLTKAGGITQFLECPPMEPKVRGLKHFTDSHFLDTKKDLVMGFGKFDHLLR